MARAMALSILLFAHVLLLARAAKQQPSFLFILGDDIGQSRFLQHKRLNAPALQRTMDPHLPFARGVLHYS